MTNRVGVLLLLALASQWGCSEQPKEGLPIGLLLPRTGQFADSGGHAEMAVLMAAERINAAGGVAGQPLMLVVKDTRSEGPAGGEAARKLLDASVLGIVGPEEESVASTLVPLARGREVVQISGGVSSPRFTTIDDGGLFFRTCPSSMVTATALARRMAEDGVTRASLIYVSNDFGNTFIASANLAFRDAGGVLVAPGRPVPISVQPGAPDYRELLTELLAVKPEALLLATDPITGAQLIRDWKVIGGTGRLYLAPPLMTDVFVSEVPAGSLDGAVGVSALSGQQLDHFAREYAAFSGEHPAQSAYFYFDAMAVLALAIERANQASDGKPTGAAVRAALAEVASPPGEQVRWDDLGRGLALVAQGGDVDYVGASGNVDFDSVGDVALEQVGFWTVRASQIVMTSAR